MNYWTLVVTELEIIFLKSLLYIGSQQSLGAPYKAPLDVTLVDSTYKGNMVLQQIEVFFITKNNAAGYISDWSCQTDGAPLY